MVNTDPEISVIVSTYNRNHPHDSCPNLLKRALDCILNQTFKNFELILIDDASTDGTHLVCQEYAAKDIRIKYYRFEENSSLPAKRYNQGISFSKTKYITFMFDDDVWYPHALQTLYNAITLFSHCGMIYGLANFVNTQNVSHSMYGFGGKWCWKKLKETNFLCNNSVIIKRDIINIIGGYDEDPIMRRLCDWDLWWRIARKFRVKKINAVLGEEFHGLPNSVITRFDLHFDEVKRRMLLFDRPLSLKITRTPFKSVLHACWFDFYFWINPKIEPIIQYDYLKLILTISESVKRLFIKVIFQPIIKILKMILGEPVYLQLRSKVKK